MLTSFRFKGYRLPFFLLLMLTFATVILGDNAAESLLLARYDATIIAKLFSLNATLLFLFSLFMISLIDRIDRGKLFTRFLLFHTTVLLSSWVIISLGFKALVIPLFSYAYVSKIFIFLIFWTLANDIVDPRRAARDFPKIAAGGTLGAISISFLIPVIVGTIPAEALLFVWALLTALVLLLFQPIRNQFGKSFLPSVAVQSRISKMTQISEDVKTIGRDPLLKSMAFFYFLLFFVLLNQQYGFYTVLNERFSDAADISRFLGFFNGTSMAVTFLLQVTLSSVVIRRIGSTRAMLILPVVFTLVFLFLRITQQFDAAMVLFWGTVVGLGLRIAVFDSFYSPNFQIFFSSLPKAIRGRGKISLEGVVKPVSMILASLWLTFLMPKLPETAATSILVAASIAMIILTLKMRKQYTRSLTRYLTDFRNRTPDEERKYNSSAVVPQIRELMAVESFEVQCYLVEILADMRSQIARDELTSMLYSADEALLPKVIEALAPLALPEVKPRMKELLRGTNNSIITAAIRAVAEYNDSPDELLPFLTSPSTTLQLTVIELLWWRVTPAQRQSMVKEIEVRLQSGDAEILFATLDLCGKIDDPLATGLIPKRFPTFTDPLLMSHYSWQRFTAALSDLEGEDILDWILENSDQRGGPQLKSLISAVQNIIATGYPVESILNRLETSSLRQRYLLSGGIALWGRTQSRYRKQIQQLLEREFTEMIYSEKLFTTISQIESDAGELLSTAIEEELLALHRFTATSLASMLDKKGEIRQVAHRLTHSDTHIRSQALEVLDNVGDRKLNHRLINHLSLPKSSVKASSADLFIAIEELEASNNRWLRECAHFAMSTFSQEVKA